MNAFDVLALASSDSLQSLSLFWSFVAKMFRLHSLWISSLALTSVVYAQEWWLGKYSHIGKVAFQTDQTYPAYRDVVKDFNCDSKFERISRAQD